jgi:hypothetical protein
MTTFDPTAPPPVSFLVTYGIIVPIVYVDYIGSELLLHRLIDVAYDVLMFSSSVLGRALRAGLMIANMHPV